MDTIQFDYQFISTAEGLLSVFLDNQLVFKADEWQAIAGLNDSGPMPVGTIGPGSHVLFPRLDPFSDKESILEISNLRTGNMKVTQKTNQAPIANPGTNQTVHFGSLVRLDGSRSFDPDNIPSPLRFSWSQVAGPPITLNGANTATPSFTPIKGGDFGFQLVVNDGLDASSPAGVVISVQPTDSFDQQTLAFQLVTPNGWEVLNLGKRYRVTWTASNFSLKQKLKLKWSKNGGTKWKLLKTVRNKGKVIWTPKRSHVTDNARLMICVPKIKKTPRLCDASDGTFRVTR